MNSEARKIRDVIEGFLEERLAVAIGDKEPEELVRGKYVRESWLARAASGMEQLRLVHYTPKFSSTKIPPKVSLRAGISLHEWEPSEHSGLVTTPSLAGEKKWDLIGNAARNTRDLYEFMTLEWSGESFVALFSRGCRALQEALSDDEKVSAKWMHQFLGYAFDKYESHQYAKQVYFPIGESEYHLISPLYPTSLAHAVKARIDDSRFGEPSKEARKARRAGQWSDHGYAEYSNLTVQNFGGTKPQNVSQLNSQRRGEALLLASCPPSWDQHAVRPPLASSSVFRSLLYRHASVREAVDKLAKFLLATDYNNANIRRERARLVEVICDEVLFVASSIQSLESGWSAKPECKLDTVEALWLDPGRALEDEGFAERQRAGDYTSEVASRFAKWLNGALKRKKLVLGDVEYKEWQSLLLREIRSLPLEVHV